VENEERSDMRVIRLDTYERLSQRFRKMLQDEGETVFNLAMPLSHWCIIHGLVALALDHPGISDLSEETPKVAGIFRDAFMRMVQIAGLTEAEAEALHSLREGDKE
jgi:hypothetical protein